MNPFDLQTKSFEERLTPGTKHRDTYAGIIADAGALRGKLLQAREQVIKDNKLSDVGKRDAIASRAKALSRDLLELGRTTRKGRAWNEGRKAQFDVSPKPLDPGDSVAELQRQEIRGLIRSEADTGKKMAMVQAFLDDPTTADAVLSARNPALLGVPAHQFATIREVYVEAERIRRHGPALREIDALANDIEIVDVALTMATRDIQTASGLNDSQFEQHVAPMRAQIDAG